MPFTVLYISLPLTNFNTLLYDRRSVMKNFRKYFGIIVLVSVIGFSMASCDNQDNWFGDTKGSLTITDFPLEYHEKYVSGSGVKNDLNLWAWGNEPFIDGKISSSGIVTLKVWTTTSSSSYSNYIGNDTITLSLRILNASDANKSFRATDPAIGQGYVTVTFVNGIGNGVFTRD